MPYELRRVAMTQESHAPKEPWPGISMDWRKKNNLNEETPEIVAIFKQIKNLRECDRSLRSLRRNMELDNVPTSLEADVPTYISEITPPPQDELANFLDSFLQLRREKDELADKMDELVGLIDKLQETAHRQAEEIEKLKNRG